MRVNEHGGKKAGRAARLFRGGSGLIRKSIFLPGVHIFSMVLMYECSRVP